MPSERFIEVQDSPRFVEVVRQESRSLNEGLSALREEAGRGITNVLSAGRPETRMGAKFFSGLLNPVPSSIGEAALMIVDPAIAIMPGAGAVRKGLATAGLHAAKDAMEGRSPLEVARAAGIGFGAGALGGVVADRATGGVAKRSLRMTGLAIETYGSPELRAAVQGWQEGPFRFTSETTLRKMQRGASDAIQSVFDQLAASVPPTHVVTLKSIPPARRMSALRDLQGPAGAIDGTLTPVVRIEDAITVRMKLKKRGDDLWHDVERDILESLPAPQQHAYAGALRQYARDQRMIDHVKELQAQRALPSGVNPTDYPALIPAEKALQPSSGRGFYHLAAGLVHPTSPMGAVHLGEAARSLAMARKGPLTTYTPPSALRRGLGKVAAGTIGEVGATSQAGIDTE